MIPALAIVEAELILQELARARETQVVDVPAAPAGAAAPEPIDWPARIRRQAEVLEYLEYCVAEDIDVPSIGSRQDVKREIGVVKTSPAYCDTCGWMQSVIIENDGFIRCGSCRRLVDSMPPRDCGYFGHREPCTCGYDFAAEVERTWVFGLLTDEARTELRTRLGLV